MTDPLEMLTLMKELVEEARVVGVDCMEDNRWLRLVNLREELEGLEILPEDAIQPRKLNIEHALNVLTELIEVYSL